MGWKLLVTATWLSAAVALGQGPKIGNCPVFPADNIWNTPVDQLPVASNSTTLVNTIGANTGVHADFGSGTWNGAPIGIPFITVPGTQTKYPVTFQYASESDPGPYAIPLNAPLEGNGTGDSHVIAIDTDNCILYEMWASAPQAGSWQAGSGAIFQLTSDALRPDTWTSADAAGLPIFPGLARYDEVAAGAILHALRFTVPTTQKAYVWPGRHYASSTTSANYPPMGARFRLRATFDITPYSAANQVILKALKKYGMMVADNGSAWYISGAPDPRWDNNDLHALGAIKGSDFELVDVSSLQVSANSGQARQSGVVTNYTLTLTAQTGGTIAANPPSANGQYAYPTVVSITATPSAGYSFSGFAGDISGLTNPQSITMTSDHAVTAKFTPIVLNRTSLNFGVRPGRTSPAQTVSVKTPAGLAWTATPSAANIIVSPQSGSGSGKIQISVTPGASGTVSLGAAGYTPLTIAINIHNLPATPTGPATNPSNTMGSVDQPAATQTTGFSGAIPVTGWALDDVGVAKVSLYREPVPQDAAGSIVTVLGKSLVWIGDSIFLADTRPDVVTAAPTNPENYRAGWGMLFLTNTTLNANGTPGAGGNGTYHLHVIATSDEGYLYELATRTITVDNQHAVLPFGTIDTPTQGEQVTITTQYTNFGWALTAQPNTIPTDGSTMFVSLDGANAGRPVFGFPRADIDGLFPGYTNSGKAVGYYYLNTAALSNGIHSIAWSVRDNAGNLQGIGSRVFYVNNPSLPVPAASTPRDKAAAAIHHDRVVRVRRGPDFEAPLEPVARTFNGYIVPLAQGERLEIHCGRPLVGAAEDLPPGSSVDLESGVFYWQPPVMARGEFPIVLVDRVGGSLLLRVRISGATQVE